jgi:P-type Cu+ transporter
MTVASPLAGETADAAGAAEFEFAIGGMTCAACAARVQTRLNKVDGVTATVNYATGQARITAPAGTSAGSLAEVVEAAGYTAEQARPAESSSAAAEDAAVRRLRRRLYLALVFFIPLTDLSIVLSVFPWSRASRAGSGSWWRWPRRWRPGRRGRSTRPR